MTHPTLPNKYRHLCLSLLLAFLALLLTWTTLVHAQSPGDLDTSFGNAGVVTTTIGGIYDQGHSIALQSDGKIVVAGESENGGGYLDFALARYTITGTLDKTFNNTGVLTTPTNELAASVAIQPDDGKIVVAGGSRNSNIDFAVARYTITGTLDTTFNDTGLVTTPIGNDHSRGHAVALQPDGKIIVAGVSIDGNGNSNFAVARYTITGTLDTAFNNTGLVTTGIGNDNTTAYDAVLQPDGKIVVVGSSKSGFTVVRYEEDGELDHSFNSTGIVTTPVGSGNNTALGVALQPDDKIVIVGDTDFNGSNSDVAVIRYNEDGSLDDATFNSTGVVITNLGGGSDTGRNVALQPNGKIVVAVQDWVQQDSFKLIRYHSDGSLDTTFDGSGIVTTPIGNNSLIFDVAIQPDGKIVAAGRSDNNFAVARYFGDPILNLTKTANNNTPAPGQRITYTLGISNSGTISATNAIISNTLPGDLTPAGPVTLDPPGAGTTGSPPVLVSGLAISPNQHITVTFPVTVGAGLTDGVTLTNVAAITSTENLVPITATAVITIVVPPDTQPPSFPATALITPTQGITVTTARPTFDWKDASDNVGVISYTLFITGDIPVSGSMATQVATAAITTTLSFLIPYTDMPNAVYTWTANAYDAAGNVATVSPPENFAIQTESNSAQPVYLPIILK